jgi:hypothetical protein
MPPESPFNQIFQELKVRYGDYHLKKLVKDTASDASTVTYITGDDGIDFADNLYLETNIYDALMHAVNAKHTLTESERNKLLEYAKVFIPNAEGDS